MCVTHLPAVLTVPGSSYAHGQATGLGGGSRSGAPHSCRMRARLLVLAPLLLIAGCGNHIVYQSRYVPRPSQMAWNRDYLQLPWQPPSLGEEHLQRNGEPAKPQYAAEIDYAVETGPDGQLTDAFGDTGALDEE